MHGPITAGGGAVSGSRYARLAVRITLGTLALLVVAGAVVALGYRSTYNVWPGQAASARVHWCGRDYENFGGSPLTWSQVSSQGQHPVRPVGRYPPLSWSGQELFAAVTPAGQRNSLSPPLPCAMIVYLRTGSDRYASYSLEGGP
jgi:hypothetical protein